jgi:endoglucanase
MTSRVFKSGLLGMCLCLLPSELWAQECSTEGGGRQRSPVRGANVDQRIDEAGLRVLGQEWNADHIRWTMMRNEQVGAKNSRDFAAYQKWLDSALERLDKALPLCEKYGLRVVVDLHSPPGGHTTFPGYTGSDYELFTDAACQRTFVEVWRQMARRYKNAKAIWAFDLTNEPNEPENARMVANWHDLAERAAKAIRQIDPRRTLIVEPPPNGRPKAFKSFRPIAVSNVLYSVHMYVPVVFTHQGPKAGKGYRYPGQIEGTMWDKARLEAELQPVVDFQQKYNVPIYVGEFGAIRWAYDGSACRYLKDVIDIFETHQWDWTIHHFRGWHGWSIEHGTDPKDRNFSKTPTDREQLLRFWFAKNKKPN